MALHPLALFTTDDARKADAAAIASGITSATLMMNAATACTDVICKLYSSRPTLIICGHGNNGGDGKLIADILKKRGWPATESDVQSFSPSLLNGKQLIVDALFGTGLNRPVEGAAKEIIAAINASNVPVVAVDIASGINATTGEIMGIAINATHSVTFVRPKLGQLVLPGKSHSGVLHVMDIGIKGDTIQPKYHSNAPLLWKHLLPQPKLDAHKYTRGHSLVMGGGIASTGAAKLAATAALRAGSGLVSIACPTESLPVYAASLSAVMTKPIANAGDLELLLEDARITSVLIGPGYGVGNKTREATQQILSHGKPCVIDADAISSFKNDAQMLFRVIQSDVVLTPHEGEFNRIFDDPGTKIPRAQAAAKKSNAIIVYKGSDTVIAAPDGRTVINNNAPPWLATAGSGDVLAGIICGLMAQRMPAFDAACAAAWIQGEAANRFGPGLISEDLLFTMPAVWKELYA